MLETTTSTPRRAGRAATVVLALLVAAACTQDDDAPAEPTDPPEATSESEPYASPEPTITTEPEQLDDANQETPEGAIAFVQHYRDLYEYGTATGDWQPLEQATADNCEPCTQLWNPEGHLETRGGQHPVITYNDEDSVKLSFMEDNPFVSARIETSAGKWVLSDGSKEQEVGPESWSVWFYLDWKNDNWTVRDLEIREPHGERELDYIW